MIKNTDRYRNCFCNKENETKVVELYEFPREKSFSEYVFRQEILFVIRGSAVISVEGMDNGRKLTRGEFIFVPAGSCLNYKTTRDTALLAVRVDDEMPECPVLKIEAPEEGGTTCKKPDTIYPLKVNRRLANFVADMMETLHDGFVCRHFLLGEANRLLFLLNAYYAIEERLKFFSHILTPDIKFSEFVRRNHTRFHTIGELADAMCLTSQAFSSRFKKVFGMTPHKWIMQEKARQIYLDICRSDMPLKEIALKYDFPLSSNFFRFCKQTFGQSPGAIRRRYRQR